MKFSKLEWLVLIFVTVLWVLVPGAAGVVRTAATPEEIHSKLPELAPGDTMVIASGQHDIGAIWIKNLHGNEKNWIVIQGDDNGTILVGSRHDNVINLDSVSYLRFENLTITTNGEFDDIDGVKFRSNSHHVTFDNCIITGVTNVGINSQVPEIHHIVVTECEISYCAEVGIYWGFDDPLKIARDCIIQRSYIHHCPSNQSQETGYGIQIKGGSYRNVIADNVLHHVGGTSRAGIAVYYAHRNGGQTARQNNIISGNIVWNVPHEGIYAAAGATVENNLIIDAGTGLAIYPYKGSTTENLIIRHNTIYRCKKNGILISGWQRAGNECVVINNAVFMESRWLDALDAKSRGLSILSHNYYYGRARGFASGAKAAGTPAQIFEKTGKQLAVTELDLHLRSGSILNDRGTDMYGYSRFDFEGKPRRCGDRCDVGAFEWSPDSHGRQRIELTFKHLWPEGAGTTFQNTMEPNR